MQHPLQRGHLRRDQKDVDAITAVLSIIVVTVEVDL